LTEYEQTEINRVRRVPLRGHYDSETIYDIVDDALICHVGFVHGGRPFVIPTLHARRDNEILLHGATTSRLIRHVQAGHEICITMTHVDGIVLARSVFHHSINYRSVVLFGRGHLVEGDEATMAALEHITDRLMPGRWADARSPNRKELKATAVVAMPIETASAKVRSGPPGDDEEDYALPVWAGVLPIIQHVGLPEADGRSADDIVLPDYVVNYRAERGHNGQE
jgi:nitroimidazol reductase NimA-like FMN-containing flavoprotein (pyridoxamine 5'-phosphate oxidase superfamily)